LSDELRIRPAGESDVDVIHALLTQMADGVGPSDKFVSTADDIRKFGFGERPKFQVLLAELDNTVVGLSLFFYNFSSWRGKLGVYIQDIVVDRGARKRGVGAVLISETVRRARSDGATHLRLSVEGDNHRAIGFYEKLGMSESRDERIFEAEGDDFVRLAEQQ
jgi:ribosomal protein S18 acetylase RimI-like enzyme